MRKRVILAAVLVVLTVIPFQTEASAQMIRFVALWEVPGNDGVLDEWYRKTHSQECLERVGPWLRRYWTYRSYRLGPEVDKFNVTRYRVTEMWYESVASRDEAVVNFGALSPPPVSEPEPGDKRLMGQIFIPANPTERFVDAAPPPRQEPYFRWLMVIRYPEGVTREEGDAWYTQVHAPEIGKLPGVLRFVSYASVDNPPAGLRASQSWARMSELWFDNYDAWKSVFLDRPPAFTVPEWGGAFPFVEIVSTFCGDRPDMDFLHGKRRIP